MIRCDRLPPHNILTFSDDRALLPTGFNDLIQEWLSGSNPRPYILLQEPFRLDPEYSGEVATLTVSQVCFHRQHWQLNNMSRIFRAAACIEHDWHILGPEVHPRHGHIIAPSPVVDVIIRQEDQPPGSVQDWARRASEVWAGLSDAERERHPRIGQVAALLDLDAML